jgi:hypothetical protein
VPRVARILHCENGHPLPSNKKYPLSFTHHFTSLSFFLFFFFFLLRLFLEYLLAYPQFCFFVIVFEGIIEYGSQELPKTVHSNVCFIIIINFFFFFFFLN